LETAPGKEYEVVVSGELKDGKHFNGSARTTITEWKGKHSWRWNHPGWLNSQKDLDNLWNRDQDFEAWWNRVKRQRR